MKSEKNPDNIDNSSISQSEIDKLVEERQGGQTKDTKKELEEKAASMSSRQKEIDRLIEERKSKEKDTSTREENVEKRAQEISGKHTDFQSGVDKLIAEIEASKREKRDNGKE